MKQSKLTSINVMSFRIDPSANIYSLEVGWIDLHNQLHVHVVPSCDGFTAEFLRGQLEVRLDGGRTSVGLQTRDELTLGLYQEGSHIFRITLSVEIQDKFTTN